MESIFTGDDRRELFPNPQKSSGMSSTTPDCSAFSPTLRGEAFLFPPLSQVRSVVPLPSTEKGKKQHGPFGGAHPAAKVRDEGPEGFLSEIPTSNYSYPPLGSGQREARPDCPCGAGSHRAGEEGLEAGGGSCPG